MTTPREYKKEKERKTDRRRLYDQKKWKQRKTCGFGRGHKWSYPNGKGFMGSTRRTCSKCGTRQIFVRNIWNMMEWVDDVHSPSFPIPFPSYSEDPLPGDIKIKGQTEYEMWKAKRWTIVLVVINIVLLILVNTGHQGLIYSGYISKADALIDLVLAIIMFGMVDACALHYLWVGKPYCNPF